MNAQTIKLMTLDRRHKGFTMWKYYIHRPKRIPLEQSKILFYNWRNWCWSEWGPSKELEEYTTADLFDNYNSSNSHWCWTSDRNFGIHRIYLRSDLEATAFALKWI